MVGLGSFAFHTLATHGAALLDIILIAVFIHGYLFVALRRFIGLGCLLSLAIVVAFFAFREGLPTVLPRCLLNDSVGYLPALTAMLVIGWMVRAMRAGKTMLAAATVFAVSLTFRTIDQAVCTSLPLGTHAAWHTLNAVVLYLLIRAAIDAGPASARGQPRT